MAYKANIGINELAKLRDTWVAARAPYQRAASAVTTAQQAVATIENEPSEDPVAFVHKVIAAREVLKRAEEELERVAIGLSDQFDQAIEPDDS
ncbi:MAG TPA: hypothetical protein VGM29_10950 [Polyangiaceae bacterium]